MGRGPFKMADFIGQKNLMKRNKRLIENAAGSDEGKAPPSILVGSTGAGKTTFVGCLAKIAGTTFHAKTVTVKTNIADLKNWFSACNYFDVLFLDEVHNLTQECQEFIYQILDSGSYQETMESPNKNNRHTITKSVANINIFAATDQPGKGLQKAFLRRFILQPMEEYSREEIRHIIQTVAEKNEIDMTPQAATLLSKVTKLSPGEATKTLRELIAWIDPDSTQITEADVRDYLHEMGSDPETGLSRLDKQYLRVLNEMPTKRVTLSQLSTHLKYDENFLRRYVEPPLIRDGFIRVEACGRALTEKGYMQFEGLRNDQNR